MSTISARVTLLMLATVMFSVVWSNDHKPAPAKQRTVVSYKFPTACPEQLIEPVSHELVQEQPVMELVTDASFLIDSPLSELTTEDIIPLVAHKPAIIRVSELKFPLPSNLTIGEYRIIDRYGNVETLSVTNEELTSWGITTNLIDQNSYEVCVGEDRWHFIRIEQSVTPAPTQKEIANAWKFVFHLADRKVSPAMEKASAPMARWFKGELKLSSDLPAIQ